jgi:UDP-N-acetyl-D-mannosaminuronic acid dehydrogenase
MAASLEEALKDAQALLLLVRHSRFEGMQPEAVAALTPARIVVDTVDAWDPGAWGAAGFKTFRLGDTKSA